MAFISWFALMVSAVVAVFLGALIWRQKEAANGAFIAFSVFAGIPIVVLSLPEIIPMAKDYCVQTPEGRYCLDQIVEKAIDAEKKADTADAKAEKAVDALEQSVKSLPPMQLSTTPQNPASAPRKLADCRPYTYSNGFEPSPGLLLIGAGKNNWYPVVASIYTEAAALDTAAKLQTKNSTYPLEVHKAADAKGKAVRAVTLGSGLSQNEASARVCYAQQSGIFDRGSYAWASDKWGSDLRAK